MDRIEKAQVVDEMKEKFTKASAAFVTEYRGMTVGALDELRTKIRQGNGELHVIKNRLARIATKGSDFEALGQQFKGPVALALSFQDPVPVAKALCDSLAETSPFKIRSGSLNGRELTDKDIQALSKLPDRHTLLSMMVGALKAPIQNFVGVTAALPRNLVNVLTAVKDKKN